jgi:type I restriction enzyme S subunit
VSLDKTLFPDGWKVVPISDVVFFQEGPGVRRFQYTDSGVKLLNGGNINKGILNLSTTVRYISDDEAYGKYNHFLVEEGDLLIACSGVVVEKFDGKIAYARKEHLPLCMNTSTMRFRSLDRDILHLDYFRWFLTTTFFKRQLQQLITGSAQLNFGPSHIKLMSIPLPPLETQRQIAAVLEKADQLRKDCRLMEQELNSLAQSVFIDMFGDPVTNPKGWEPRLLKDFYESEKTGTKCGPFGSALKKDEYVSSGIPVWNMDNISLNGKFVDGASLWITEDKFKELEGYSVNQGDVIISRAGTVGKMGVVSSAFTKSIISTNLIRVRFGRQLHPLYFVSLMIYFKTRLKRLKVGDDGSFSHMNTGVLDALEFPYPPIEEQLKYVTFREMVDFQIQMLQELKAQYEEEFNSLMQKAFKGELNLKTKAA